jgi:hypothetical protein
MTSNPHTEAQMSLPGGMGQRLSSSKNRRGGRRIPHLEILKALQDPALGVANIVDTYQRLVLPIKTRSIHLLGRKSPARIIETLLGYEVKASYKRIHCPDMVTARYVKLFTEIGCRNIRLPYDPTVTANLIPQFEQSMAKIVSGVRDIYPKDRRLQVYVIRNICERLREQIKISAASQTKAATNNTNDTNS